MPYMAQLKKVRVVATSEFSSWYNTLKAKVQAQIDARLHRIEQYAHFGDSKDLGGGLAELRWSNGRRIYFTRIFDDKSNSILLLLGGLKNAQKKDIKKARLLIQKYVGQ